MHEETGLPGHAPLTPLSGETVLVDRDRDRPVLRLAGTVVLPPGATVDLPGSAQRAAVVGVRLRPDTAGSEAMAVHLEVDVPPAYWDEREAGGGQAVPAPIAAATADLDLNPDASAPLGTPLS